MENHSKKPIYLIAACSENRVIGKDGTLPWRIKEDLNYLYQSVKGGIVIEGRRVYEELKKPFPETHTIVLTRNRDLSFPDVSMAGDLDEALKIANNDPNYSPIWICGGQGLYEETIRIADRLYITLVHTEVEGDTFFPEWRNEFTKVVSERKSENKKYQYRFLVLERP